jgi:O-antigen/teichoic acid export membrane protein
MGIAFVPLYIGALGVETYGLIGIFSVLQACMTLLDLGLTPTLNREMARLRAGAHTAASIRDLLRSLEIIYSVLSAFMILIIWLGSSWLANNWLRVERISPDVVVLSIKIMAVVLTTRWLEQVYRGALQGMEDQIWLNGMQAILATVRWGGAYVLVTFAWPSIIAFFIWQGCASFLTTVILIRRTYRVLPASPRTARFSMPALREIYGFASGMFTGAILSLVLTQVDKVVISKLLPLDQIGYYMLAATLSGGLLLLITPMNTAVYPKLTEQVALNDFAALSITYQHACEWLSAIIIPPALLLAFFAYPALMAWTGNAALAKSASTLVVFLAVGTLFNGLMNMPYMLQLAFGWTSLSIRINIVAVALLVPITVWSVPRYGAVGAALAWLILNASYLVITAHIMHLRILPGRKRSWYFWAIAAPLSVGTAISALIKELFPEPTSRVEATVTIGFAYMFICVGVILALPNVRQKIIAAIKSIFKNRSFASHKKNP